jgi:hypothetical protein
MLVRGNTILIHFKINVATVNKITDTKNTSFLCMFLLGLHSLISSDNNVTKT